MSAVTNGIERLIKGVDKLNSFKKPETAANFFAKLGYKGNADPNARDCVVSQFLRDCMGDPDADVSCTGWDIRYVWPKSGEYLPRGNSLALALSDVMREFVIKFDTGEWPELLKPETGSEPEPLP